MSSISLLYGHDSRSGQRSYRIVAHSADLAREQLAKVEALITRLCFDVRVVGATPGYFALWLTPSVRILGRFSVQSDTSQGTLEGRMVILTQTESKQSVLNWFQYLEFAEHWQLLANGSLASPQLHRQEVSRSHLAAFTSAHTQNLPWDLIASNSLEVITSWYLGLPADAQSKACIVAPCLCPQSRIQDYLQGVHFIAGRDHSDTANPVPLNRKRQSLRVAAVVFSLGALLGFYLGSRGAYQQVEPKSAEIHPIVSQSIHTSLELTVDQEKEMEALCKGLRSLADQYTVFERWNLALQSEDQNTASLPAALKHLNHYFSYAEDANNPMNERLNNLSFAMGDLGELLERPLEIGSSVDGLLERLKETEKLLSKIRTKLSWQKNQANPNFKTITADAEALVNKLEAALREWDIKKAL